MSETYTSKDLSDIEVSRRHRSRRSRIEEQKEKKKMVCTYACIERGLECEEEQKKIGRYIVKERVVSLLF